eukprot:1155605_1
MSTDERDKIQNNGDHSTEETLVYDWRHQASDSTLQHIIIELLWEHNACMHWYQTKEDVEHCNGYGVEDDKPRCANDTDGSKTELPSIPISGGTIPSNEGEEFMSILTIEQKPSNVPHEKK